MQPSELIGDSFAYREAYSNRDIEIPIAYGAVRPPRPNQRGDLYARSYEETTPDSLLKLTTSVVEQSYEIETRPSRADLVIRNSSDQRLTKGNHVLQVSVSTWNEPAALARELGVSWRKYGILWWQGVTSEVMPFKIEKLPSTVKCS